MLSSTGSPKLTVTNSETIASLAGGGEVEIASGQILTVKNSAGTNTSYSGVISGAGGLTKGAAAGDTGRLTLGGNNTFAGAVNVAHGVLRITHENALGTPPSGTSNGGTSVAGGATLELAGGSANLDIPNSEALSLNGAGVGGGGALRNVSGSNTWNGAITLGGDTTITNANTGAGNTLTLGNATNGISGAHNLTLAGAGNTLIAGAITTGSGGLTKTGGGTLTLGGTGDNTYAGVTTISAGILRIRKNNALGTPTGEGATNGGTTVADGATLELANDITVPAGETLSLNGAGLGGRGALRNVSGGNTISGAIILADNTTIHNASSGTGATLTLGNATNGISGAYNLILNGAGNTLIAGAIQTDARTLTKTGAGKLTLTGNNTYTGDTTVNEGELELANTATTGEGAIADTGTVTLAAGAKLTITESETLGALTGGAASGGTGAAETTIANGQTLTLKGIGGGQYAGRIRGMGNLTYNPGSGSTTSVFTLSGNNDYSGGTTVSAGILAIASNTALGTAAGDTTVESGATLRLAGGASGLNVAGEALTLNGGTLESYDSDNIWAGAITLDGNATLRAEGVLSGAPRVARLRVTGNITKNQHRLTLAAVGGGIDSSRGDDERLASEIIISGNISGAPTNDLGLTVTSPATAAGQPRGRVTLSGTNTYRGLTRVNSGILSVSNNAALGASGAGNGTTVAGGATLRLLRRVAASNAGVNIAGEALTLNNGTLEAWNSDSTWGGDITLENPGTLKADAAYLTTLATTGAHLRVTGNIANGAHDLTLNATGRATRTVDSATQTRAASQITLSGRIGPAGDTPSAGGLIKTGGGTATLSGSGNYTGRHPHRRRQHHARRERCHLHHQPPSHRPASHCQ